MHPRERSRWTRTSALSKGEPANLARGSTRLHRREECDPDEALRKGGQRALLGVVEVQEACEARDLHYVLDRGVGPADLHLAAVDLDQLGRDEDGPQSCAAHVFQLP